MTLGGNWERLPPHTLTPPPTRCTAICKAMDAIEILSVNLSDLRSLTLACTQWQWDWYCSTTIFKLTPSCTSGETGITTETRPTMLGYTCRPLSTQTSLHTWVVCEKLNFESRVTYSLIPGSSSLDRLCRRFVIFTWQWGNQAASPPCPPWQRPGVGAGSQDPRQKRGEARSPPPHGLWGSGVYDRATLPDWVETQQ